MRRAVSTLGLVVAAALLIFNFRARDPIPPPDALLAPDPMPVVTTVPGSTTSTTMSARAMALAAATSTTTTTTQAPLPTSLGASAFVGPEIDTRFGPMQVEIIVADGVIEDVVPLKLPMETRTSRLLTRIVWPLYREWTIERQSSDVDFTSSATVTWEAYIESLEAAMDSAGLL
jgi:uncharacterized protein with FMN-binding domain